MEIEKTIGNEDINVEFGSLMKWIAIFQGLHLPEATLQANHILGVNVVMFERESE